MDEQSKLLFWRPADGNGRLVFGDIDDSATTPDAVFSADAELPGLDVGGPLRYATRLSSSADLPGLEVAGALAWDANVARPVMGQATSRYQRARGIAAGARSRWQHSERVASAVGTRWQLAVGLAIPVTARWQQSQALRSAAAVRYQHALGLLAQAGSRYQYSAALRAFATSRYQHAQPLAVQARSSYQHMLQLRPVARGRYQIAAPIGRPVEGRFRAAQPVGIGIRNRYQIAWWPQAGMHGPLVPPGVDPVDPCYDPATLSRLIFEDAWANDGRLVFVCVGHGTLPNITIIIPTLGTYMVDNDVSLVRLSDGKELEALEVNFSLDYASWTWSFSATVHPRHRVDLQRPLGGDPVRVRASVNGQDVDFVVDELDRERSWQEARLQISGRGLSASLGSPLAPALSRDFADDMLASQMAASILTVNGVPFGWSVLWNMADWYIPGGSWSHQGTFIDALTELASAAGGYVQPTRTTQELRFLRKYPTLPRDWSAATPDIQLPSDAVVVEGMRWVDKPVYTGVLLRGMRNGVEVIATTQGTSGAAQATQVIHPLITSPDAARGAAENILSDVGRQIRARLRTPIFPAAGLILPGSLLRYVDEGVQYTGLVRSLSVEASYAESWQTIEVELHE